MAGVPAPTIRDPLTSPQQLEIHDDEIDASRMVTMG